jgi:hypothetical protein
MSEPEKRSPSPADRRASRRRPPRGSIRIECRKGSHSLGRNIGKQFLDLSETGVRLLASAELRPGDEVEVILTGGWSMKPLKRLGRVVWAFKAGEDGYCAGLRFDKPLSYTQVQELSSPPSPYPMTNPPRAAPQARQPP